MGFGNPYGDPWNTSIIKKWVDNLIDLGVRTISLSDTTGNAKTKDIDILFKDLILANII